MKTTSIIIIEYLQAILINPLMVDLLAFQLHFLLVIPQAYVFDLPNLVNFSLPALKHFALEIC